MDHEIPKFTDALPSDQPAGLNAASNQTPYPGPERRTAERIWRDGVNKRLQDGSDKMQGLRDDLDKNTATTQQIKADTSEVIALLNSFKGAVRVLDMLARLARPLGYLAAAGGSLYGLVGIIKGGGPRA